MYKDFCMIERIFELLTLKKLSPTQFADEIGIQRSGISHLVSGRNKPSLEFILKVLNRYPEVNAEWLLLGKGSLIAEANHLEELEPKNTLPLFEECNIKGNLADQKVIKKKKNADAEKDVDKLIVLYKDRTFREYKQDE